MGVWVSVRGWIECNNEQWPVVTSEVDNFHKHTLPLLADSWSLQSKGGGYSRFAFFGCTLRESEVEGLKNLLQHLSTISSRDGECIDFLYGLFTVSHELSGDHEGFFWVMRSGRFTECEKASASLFDEITGK